MFVKLIVWGLSEDVCEEHLYDLFDVYGHIVDVAVEGGGRGYVVYDDRMSAAQARISMNGAEVNGRPLWVRAEGLEPAEHDLVQLEARRQAFERLLEDPY